jgi:uncharacterized protein (TIGR02145 family)
MGFSMSDASLLRFPLVVLVAFCAVGPRHVLRATARELVDVRDGQRYEIVSAAGHDWLRRNLNFAAAGSSCFENADANCAARGRLYPWTLAMSSCPARTHLPSDAEWGDLEKASGMSDDEIRNRGGRGPDVGTRLKVGGASGLDLSLDGWRAPDGMFRVGNGDDHAGAYWTATEFDSASAWHRDVSDARTVVWRSPVDKTWALSVRCVVSGV